MMDPFWQSTFLVIPEKKSAFCIFFVYDMKYYTIYKGKHTYNIDSKKINKIKEITRKCIYIC